MERKRARQTFPEIQRRSKIHHDGIGISYFKLDEGGVGDGVVGDAEEWETG